VKQPWKDKKGGGGGKKEAAYVPFPEELKNTGAPTDPSRPKIARPRWRLLVAPTAVATVATSLTTKATPAEPLKLCWMLGADSPARWS
jgi:hypothetical protein